MNISHDEEKFLSYDKRVNELAKIIDEQAFEERNLIPHNDDGKSFHVPKNVYWEDRRTSAIKLAQKIIKSGYFRI